MIFRQKTVISNKQLPTNNEITSPFKSCVCVFSKESWKVMDPSNALLLPSLETPADSLGSPGLLLPSIETNALLLPDLDDENNVEVHSLTALFGALLVLALARSIQFLLFSWLSVSFHMLFHVCKL